MFTPSPPEPMTYSGFPSGIGIGCNPIGDGVANDLEVWSAVYGSMPGFPVMRHLMRPMFSHLRPFHKR